MTPEKYAEVLRQAIESWSFFRDDAPKSLRSRLLGVFLAVWYAYLVITLTYIALY